MKLLISALTKFVVGILAIGLLLFLPAGTMHYPGAWRMMGLLFVPMFLLGAVLFVKAPELLKKRLNSKEKLGEQRQVVALSGLLFAAGFVLAGLDLRFGWTVLPGWVSGVASVTLLLSYGMYAEVMRENAYLSRTVEVQEGQRVVDTGLYGLVRHPMYLSVTVLYLSMPLVLGSGAAVLPFLCLPAALVRRIRSEEALLLKELEGYRAYTQKVRYRMIPFLW